MVRRRCSHCGAAIGPAGLGRAVPNASARPASPGTRGRGALRARWEAARVDGNAAHTTAKARAKMAEGQHHWHAARKAWEAEHPERPDEEA